MFGFQKYIEKTLYHGTIIDNKPSIMNIGLQPGVGSFIRNAYADYEDQFDWGDNQAVYFADKADLEKSTTAMVSQIAHKLGKYDYNVTDRDIASHGLMCILKDADLPQADADLPQADDSGDGSHPQFAEPWDYYSKNSIVPDQCISGLSLVRFLKSHKVWPIDWTLKTMSRAEENYARGKLIGYAIRKHPEKSREEIEQKVMSMKIKDVMIMLKNYRR